MHRQKYYLTSTFAIVTLLFTGGCTAAPLDVNPPADTVDLAIENITVINPERRAILPNHSVFIENDRIVSVRPTADKSYSGESSVDGTGKYLIPGLMDMHVHTAIAPITDDSFKLMLANGVTGVRDMSADCWEPRGEIFLCIDDMRTHAAAIEAGEEIGPRLLRLASPIVQSDRTHQLPKDSDPAYSPLTEEQGRDIVNYLNERGVDFIKMYDRISPDAYRGIMAEAEKIDLEVSGHIPIFFSTTEVSNMGQRTIEHARDLITDCSEYGAVYRKGNNDTLAGVEGASWPLQTTLRVESVVTFDPEICAGVFATMISNDTYYVPTHGTRELDFRAGEEAYRSDPRLRYIKPFQSGEWTNDLTRTANNASPQDIEEFRAYYEQGLKITRLAIEAGVGVMIGTDANDTMIFPGFGVHDEMERFQTAGVAPMDILRAATTVPAAYLDQSDDLGGINEGKLADLIILSKDPMVDIGNTTSIQTVLFGGQVYDRAALDNILSDVETDEEASGSEDATQE